MADRQNPAGPEAKGAALQAILRWYAALGVDVALHEKGIDRHRAPIAPTRSAMPTLKEPAIAHNASPEIMSDASGLAAPRPKPVRPSPEAADARTGQAVDQSPASTDEAVMAAREAARSAPDLDTLRQVLEAFDGCRLSRTARSLVFADGTPGARVMLVGEAPGREEDIEGLPFVGRSGKLLDRMLSAINLKREDVYIANVVPWRPPGNRTPTPAETEICRPFINRQIELCAPEILVCLGGASAKQLFDTTQGILKLRGRWRDMAFGNHALRAMATLHPAYLLRQPAQKRLAWRDLMALRQALDSAPKR